MLVRERASEAIRYEPGMILPGLVDHPAFESCDPFLGGHWPAYAMLDGAPIHEGDWIVTRPDGSRRVVKPEAFEREYELAA
jgi:hypothetical protein